MLRKGENQLEFPYDAPRVDLSLSPGKALPGTFTAVLDPPRQKSPGGVMLRVVGDGWGSRVAEDWVRANAQMKEKVEAFAERLEEWTGAERKTPELKAKLVRAYEEGMAAEQARDALGTPETGGWGMEHRPDCVTVLDAGEGVPLSRGDRIMVAPFSGHRFKDYRGIRDFVVFGIEDDWRDVSILVWNPLDELWEPLADWCTVLLEPKAGTIRLPRPSYENWGLLLQTGPDCTVCAGQRVGLHHDRLHARPEDSKWFSHNGGPFPENACWVRESSFDVEKGRIQRRVLAVIGDGPQVRMPA